MNNWAAPLTIIVVLIFAGILFFTQTKTQNTDQLPPEADNFQPISKAPQQGQQQQAQGQAQGLQDTLYGNQQQGQQAQQQPQQQTQQLQDSYTATIKTTKGDITVTLDAKDAPHTVINFINKAQSDFYKGLTFHRVEDWVVQGGDPKGDGTGGGQMATEINQVPFKTGSLGIARKNDIKVSNDSQFFITKTDASWLDQQYTNFGEVTEGMDVVNKIQIGDKILGITVEGIN